jgi:hypothetical protein
VEISIINVTDDSCDDKKGRKKLKIPLYIL